MVKQPLEPIDGIQLHPLRTVLTDWRTYIAIPLTIATLWAALAILP